MRHLLAKYGYGNMPQPAPSTPGGNLTAKARKSQMYNFQNFLLWNQQKGPRRDRIQRYNNRRNTKQLLSLAESALPSRAISLIRNGVSSLAWAIQPKDELDSEEDLKRFQNSIKTVRAVLENPNPDDDDFPTFIGQIIEDLLVFDAGVWEYVPKPKWIRNNKVLGLYPVPGFTIDKNISWNGNPNGFRWQQDIGVQSDIVKLKDKDIEYLMHRKRTHTPYGYSALQTAFEIMNGWLQLSAYQRNVASQAYPAIGLYLGDDTDEEQVNIFRAYWNNEVQGRGTPLMWGNTGKPESIALKPAGDEGLYLQYQEMLVRILAFCFGLKPQDFGIERDVNRSTAQTSQKASVQEAILPIAIMLQSRITARVLPFIADYAKDDLIRDLRFFYVDIDPRDRKATADVHKVYLEHGVYMIDDIRKKKNLPPLPYGLGKLTPSGLKELLKKDPLALINGPDEEILRQVQTMPGSTPSGDGGDSGEPGNGGDGNE